MRRKNSVTPPQAGALATALYHALLAVTPSHHMYGNCYCGYGQVGHSPACIQARAALELYRDAALPPVAAKQKSASGMSPSEAFEVGQKILKELK